MINSLAFYDEKTGIKKLAMAERQMGMVDCSASFRLSLLIGEIEKLEKEVVNSQCQKLPVDDKLLQLERLKDKSKQLEVENDTCKKNFRLVTVEPIIEKIREKLKEFAKQKGYGIIFDAVWVVESTILLEGKVDNITSEFIQFCNDYFDREKSQ